ncbi:type I restriction-modification system subunit M [Peptostreptococcus faecalis]|uniref:type I restriction-modification system subunit M n=1 Tax=Peptostreptococcus faecalis TaxID=2045015 RepID=UPI000C79BD77|nr:type I restriction-modification system subunit M [Peptostreptococcus faecalis]
MTTEQIQAMQQKELNKRLWDIANDLRGNMEASEFKNYILGLIFYRYLSAKTENYANNLLKEDGITYAEAWKDNELRDALEEELIKNIGYCIEPENLFSSLLALDKTGEFSVEDLQRAIKAIESSTLGQESEDDFDNLFDDMDLQNSRLGRTNEEKSKLLIKVMHNIAAIDFHFEDAEIDIIGDAYEYLISQFAATAGKKAGEFYTPQQVSEILARITTLGKDKVRSVYDPTCGSGSLLLRVGKKAKVFNYVGQELTSTTYNLARMNMLLHGVKYDRFDIKNVDTLTEPDAAGTSKYEIIVANPPYSAKWEAKPEWINDPRFSNYGKLAPKSKADFAFIQHMVYHLDDNGVMAVVLPHGVLFRGAAEGVIRKVLIEKYNYLDAVIGLPANIFFGTSIPTCILIFKKCREQEDNILFIDASNEFEKNKNQNRLTDANVEKIVNTYKNRETIDKYSYVAPMSEIEENDYNLNIPRYVDTFEEETEIDLDDIKRQLEEIDKEIELANKKLQVYFDELGV